MKTYTLKDRFGQPLITSENKSDLYQRINEKLKIWGVKYTSNKQLKKDGFYIVKNN